jgi:hypothetical protein
MIGILHTPLRRLGSAETTSALIALCALVAATGIFFPIRTSDWMMLPVALLLVNLLAALATNARLKSQSMLYAFHVALVALIAVIGLDRLNSMSGRVEVTEGSMFDASGVTAEVGLLHDLRLDEVKFLQGPFEINYAPGMKRRETVSIIRIPEQKGAWREVRIGDDTPLIFGDYRFYTTHNKGFAPLLTYVSASGAAQTGAIHMPSYPINENKQGLAWTPPGAAKPLKIWLHIDEPVFDKDKAWKFVKPVNTRLVVIDGEERHELEMGQSVALGSAQLRYDGLRSWMGYTIVGQDMTGWIAAAGLIACLALLGYVVSVLVNGSREPAPDAEQGG